MDGLAVAVDDAGNVAVLATSGDVVRTTLGDVVLSEAVSAASVVSAPRGYLAAGRNYLHVIDESNTVNRTAHVPLALPPAVALDSAGDVLIAAPEWVETQRMAINGDAREPMHAHGAFDVDAIADLSAWGRGPPRRSLVGTESDMLELAAFDERAPSVSLAVVGATDTAVTVTASAFDEVAENVQISMRANGAEMAAILNEGTVVIAARICPKIRLSSRRSLSMA